MHHFQVNTYEALMPAVSNSSATTTTTTQDNSETSAELLNIERSLYELSQRQGSVAGGEVGGNVRNSFLSVDSGRNSSETYDTSNSSVSSQSTNNSSNHSNRLNSTASNCSADSGTQMSLNSGDYAQPGQVSAPVRLVTMTKSVETQVSQAAQDAPPPLPPRFATIRKSYTLPHNMAGAADNRIYDNPSTVRRGPGKDTQNRESSQQQYGTVARDCSPQQYGTITRDCSPQQYGTVTRDCSPQQYGTNPGLKKSIGGIIRPRPSSLSVEKRQYLRSMSTDRPVSSLSSFSVTQPSTPAAEHGDHRTEYSSGDHRSRSLQRGHQCSRSVSSDQLRHCSGLQSLSHSTPQDLDSGHHNTLVTGHRSLSGAAWRSNDGLITPVSFTGGSPYHTPNDSPYESPHIPAKFHPTFFTRVPLKVSRGVTGVRRKVLQGAGSVNSLNNASPQRGREIFSVFLSLPCNVFSYHVDLRHYDE